MKIAGVLRALIPAALFLSVTVAAHAEVARLDIQSRTDVLNGKSWGATGPYERLTGKVYFKVDPNNPHNKIIPLIDKAPRDANGMVEMSSDFSMLKPKDPSKGNGVAFFEATNRGKQSLLSTFDKVARGGKPTEAGQYGDGTLLNEGFTLVWVGWQFSVPHNGDSIAVDLPVAMENGKPIPGRIVNTGSIGQPMIINVPGPTIKLPPDLQGYTPVDLNEPGAVLSVTHGIYDKPQVIPRDQWQFANLVDGKVVPDAKTLYMKSGFQAGLRYDVSYTAQATPIGGLGYAAIRDLGSALKYGSGMPVKVKYEYIYGASQTGRTLREFIYDGFNADEQGRKTFDAIWAHISGSARGDFIQPFSLPDGLGIFTGSMFPFSESPERDPVTGKTDGMLSHMSPDVMPKIIYTNTETEYVGGGRAAYLMYTSLDGKTDIPVPDNVRIYMWSAAEHGPAAFPPPHGLAQQMTNPNDYYWGMRALFAAMDDWVRKGVAPPASRYPDLKNGTLIARKDNPFPKIPGVQSPAIIAGGYRADLGGPLTAPRLPNLVPKVDADGNDIGGVRMPEISVPLATYSGWNFRSPENGAPDQIIPLTGSFIPFAVTKAERLKTGDPRLSIEERYPSRDAYLAKVRAAAMKLVQERLVLKQDVDPIVAHAGMVWDDLVTGKPPTKEAKN